MAYLPPPNYSRARTMQGKVAELRLELNSGGKKDKNFAAKKIALKKIVANMTMSNNDMVALFPDIIACMHIQSIEIKKMYVCPSSSLSQMYIWWQHSLTHVTALSRCFLFLVNYARMRPEIAIKAIPVLELVRDSPAPASTPDKPPFPYRC